MKVYFRITQKTVILAGLHSIIALILCYILTHSLISSSVFFVLTFFAYIPTVHFSCSKAKYIVIAAIGIVSAVLCFVFSQFTIEWTSILSMGAMELALNIICCFSIIAFFYAIALNIKLSCTLSMIIILLLATANSYVVLFRGSSLKVADILAIGTALNVAGNYKYSVDNLVLYSWLFSIIWFIPLWKGIKLPEGSVHRWFPRIVALCICLAGFSVVFSGMSHLGKYEYLNEGNVRNGFVLNFLSSAKRSEYKKPTEYDSFSFETLESEYTQCEDVDRTPNIIVIMNESFADLRIYSNELSTSIPVMPFCDSLTENTVKGYALASTFGGGTANSEYEFLTGNTMAFLPSGISAYQNIVTDGAYSLVSHLESFGYTSIAMHPQNPNNWMRMSAWPALGFDRCLFIEDFPSEKLVRDYVSDLEVFEQIIAQIEDNDSGSPMFLYCVTMQNHSGYIDSEYRNTVKLSGYSQEYPQAEQYLSLIHETDSALEYLISSLGSMEEDTIILFYGDHQPSIESSFIEELSGCSFSTLDEQELRYTVPFFIWANYDISETSVELSSLNYLSNYLIENAGLPLSPYQAFLADLQSEVPAINVLGYTDQFGNTHSFSNIQCHTLNEYAILQYNSIYGGTERSQVFFPKS